MGLSRFITWFKNTHTAIDEHDGRDEIKVSPVKQELSPEEKKARDDNQVKAVSAIHYLTRRGLYSLTCPEFKYVTAEHTDIKATMRKYIEDTMPEVKDTYKFLFN